MASKTIALAALAAAVALAIGMRALADPPAEKKPARAVAEAKPSQPLVTISKETTYITGPLRPDGYVDYLAALNGICSKGVTNENNAAALLWEALGARNFLMEDQRSPYFKMLGMPLPEENGEHFISLNSYLQEQIRLGVLPKQSKDEFQNLWYKLDGVLYKPWSPTEFPVLAGWIAANEKYFPLLVDASKRPRFYDPRVAPAQPAPGGGKADGTLASAVGCAHSAARDAARLLSARAMMRVKQGQTEEAFSDLLAGHRLARLVGQGPEPTDAMTATAIDEFTDGRDEVLLQSAPPSAAAATRLLHQIDQLPPLDCIAEEIGLGQRLNTLDLEGVLARTGSTLLADVVAGKGYLNDKERDKATDNWPAAADDRINWNVVTRTTNSWFDQYVAALRKPTRAERNAAIAKLDAELHRRRQEIDHWNVLKPPRSAENDETISRQVADTSFATLNSGIAAESKIQDHATMQLELTKLGYALAAYHADHGAFPARLADLAPAYVATIRRDIYSDQELRYKRSDGGYLLYSVGPNGFDDGGKGYDDRKNGEKWDDLSIRVPGGTAGAAK